MVLNLGKLIQRKFWGFQVSQLGLYTVNPEDSVAFYQVIGYDHFMYFFTKRRL